jgi:proline iminopeptidase
VRESAPNPYYKPWTGLRLFHEKVGNVPQTVPIPNGFHLLDDFKPLADGRTVIYYDVRNGGRSDCSTLQEESRTVRRHFGLDRMNVIGHSYIGSMVALYAKTYPDRVSGVIQIGPTPPDIGKQYP